MAITAKEQGRRDHDPSSPQVMNAFYRRLFPYKALFRWLNQAEVPGKLWTHREFAFTIENDIYIRYNSFNTAYDFQKEVLRLNPSRFEIGPQYTARPRDRKTLPAGALQPQRRELVFDIDMTDYDEVRTCCSGAAICKRCWGFIAAAVKVLDNALRETFGFRHLLWVYSGRRGIHCWVSDTLAIDLTDDQRRQLVTFLEVVKGGKDQIKKVNVRGAKDENNLHPALEEALTELKFEFTAICLQDQDCFKSEAGWEKFLALLPANRDATEELRRQWREDPGRSSVDKWNDVRAVRNSLTKSNPALQAKYDRALEDIVLQYTYPRIDAEVSKHRNHLLKSPFCVHPGTGRVCIPVDPKEVDKFDPEDVPHVGELLVELDRATPADPSSGGGSKLAEDYERTSLKPYVDMLDAHARAIMADVRGARQVKDESMEF